MLIELWIQCLVQSVVWFLSFGLEEQRGLYLEIPDSSTWTSFQLYVHVLLHREGIQSLPRQVTHTEELNWMAVTVRPQRGFSFSGMTLNDLSCLRTDLKQHMILFVTSYRERIADWNLRILSNLESNHHCLWCYNDTKSRI